MPAIAASRSLRRSVGSTVVGNIGFAACQWLMVVVLAKFGDPTMVGQYSLALGITAPVMLLANLNLRAVQSTDVRDDHDFSEYFRLRLGTTILALIVCLAVAAVISVPVSTALVIGFIALAKAVESMSDVYYGRHQKAEDMDPIARSMLIRGGAALFVLTVVVWKTGSVAWGALGVFLTWLVVLVAYDMRSGASGPPLSIRNEIRHVVRGTAWRALWPLAWLALPLGVVQMLISLNANVPRLLVQAFEGEHNLGIFAAIAYITVAGSTFVTAVGQAVSPRLAQRYAAGDRVGFVRLLRNLLLLFAAGCAVAVAVVTVVGEMLLTILYTPDYAAHTSILLIFTLAFGVGAIVSVFGFGITAARRFRAQVPLVGLAVSVVTVSGVVLIPGMGIEGAAWSVLLSLVVWAVASAVVLRSILSDVPASVSQVDLPGNLGASRA